MEGLSYPFGLRIKGIYSVVTRNSANMYKKDRPDGELSHMDARIACLSHIPTF